MRVQVAENDSQNAADRRTVENPKPKLRWQLLDDGQFRFPKCRPLRAGSAVVRWLQPVSQDVCGAKAGSEWCMFSHFKPTGLEYQYIGSFADTDM